MPNTISKKLRAFKIENPNITEEDSGILSFLSQNLKETSTAQVRRMKLNEEDEDEDLLSNFSIQPTFLFGMMLRIIPSENGGIIPDNKFSQKTISIAELNSKDKKSSQYKDHYYFAINNKYIVTDLSSLYSIDRLQTYLNWLLSSIRGEKYFEINPVTIVPEGVKVSDIRSIEIGNSMNSVTTTVNNNIGITTKIRDVTKSVLDGLFNSSDNFTDIQREQLVSAKLTLTIKQKPKDMVEDEYQRVMGAVTKQITNDSGITIRTKTGSRYTGEAIKKIKEVDVEKTSGNRIVEEQLKQKMELFLTELNNE